MVSAQKWAVAIFLIGLGGPAFSSEPPKVSSYSTNIKGQWQPDLGNGNYQNPVLQGDYSDPDVIRVGDDYYLTASSFNMIPGLPVLHSTDLVNWKVISHALPYLSPVGHYSSPRHGGGVWAPTIRLHNGYFMIYYADPDFGMFMTKAKDPVGPWSEPVLVDNTKGAIDPAPFWDENGDGYLVYAFARSRSGKSNIIELKRLNSDGTKSFGPATTIIQGEQYPPVLTSQGVKPWFTIEGPKLYKRNDYYYIFAPAGSVKGGWQAVFRAKSITGPYEARLVMDQGTTEVNGPHQGAWVRSAFNEDWFIHFQDTDSFGRRVFLQPLQWLDSGWPLIGKKQAKYDFGEPVLQHKMPEAGKKVSPYSPDVSDEFNDGIHLGWQWNANPMDNWVQPQTAGVLRLNSVSSDANLWQAGNVLLQKLPGMVFTAETKLTMHALREGERAGLLAMGQDYSWIGIENTVDGLRLIRSYRKQARTFGQEEKITAPVAVGSSVWLRVNIEPVIVSEPKPDYPSIYSAMLRSFRAKANFEYSLDGERYVPLGSPVLIDQGRWVSSKVGLFAQSASDTPAFTATSVGYAEFSYFRVRE